ncbi:MAG: zf-HC2 domain-containing protein [Deltaproteobacteria bacterium]|nr:zf-HC2 domain-containing protein [Deltaproteobacteria bacterium]
MCDLSKKLIARIDGELSAGEAAELERHLGACSGCRNRLATYERASRAFDAYCDATLAAETRGKSRRWLRAAVAAGIAAAAVIVTLLILPYERVPQLPARTSAPTDALHVPAHPTEATVTAPRLAGAVHPMASLIKHAPRHDVAPAVPRGRNLTQERASASWLQSSQTRNLSPFPPEPHIEIAIPADAIFPPGALPEGMSFTADLTISAYGSPEQLGLRPRLAEFESRRSQP